MLTDTIKIAFQGAPGAFSHRAGLLFAGNIQQPDSQLMPCNSFEEVFNRVISRDATYGVIPIENSSIGSISVNYDLLWANPVAITAEICTPIHHHLIGIGGTDIKDIREVYSHPAALDQCKKFFAEHTHLKAAIHFDTGGAVRFIAESGDSSKAAIAGEAAAKEYGLEILLNNIEDYEQNTTRFIVISLRDEKEAKPPVPHKVSCAMELNHAAGSLAAVLHRLSQLGINLLKIESRPIPEATWHYRFFLDLQIEREDQDAALISVLNDNSEIYKIFGRYF
jgi:prephenate dehydratase